MALADKRYQALSLKVVPGLLNEARLCLLILEKLFWYCS